MYAKVKEHVIEKVNLKKKKKVTNEEAAKIKTENAKICYICKERFENKYLKDKKYSKVRDHCHYTGKYRAAGHSTCNLKNSVPKAIVFHNGSNYDYHFIIKYPDKEFKNQLICLGENTENNITFAVTIEI